MRTESLRRWILVALIAAVGIIHLVTARDQFNDATYKGLLFLANAAGSLVAAAGLARGARWALPLGLLVAGSTALGYVVSRTVGLPGLPVDPDWLEPLGVLSVLAEALYILVALHAWRSRPAAEAQPARG